MTIEQINHLKPEKLSAPAVVAEMTDELLEEALVTLTPELEGWRDRRGNKDDGTLRLVMRIHETRCSLAWIELQAWVIPVETQINSAGWNPPTSRALSQQSEPIRFSPATKTCSWDRSGQHSDPAD